MKEKTADEMFKELDYTKYETSSSSWIANNGIVYRCWHWFIGFDFDTKSLITYYDDYDSGKFIISPELYKAITKKMEELGWL